MAVGVDAKTKELEVVFTSGAVWRDKGAARTVSQELLASDSQGSCMRNCVISEYTEYPGERSN